MTSELSSPPAPCTPYSMMSMFSPSGLSQESDVSYAMTPATAANKDSPKDKLNSFLASRDISPIRYSMTTSWDAAADRTKRHYIRKAKQVIFASLEEIAPSSSQMLF